MVQLRKNKVNKKDTDLITVFLIFSFSALHLRFKKIPLFVSFDIKEVPNNIVPINI